MLKTVNGGIKRNIDDLDVEILSHHFHNPYCDIVCTYFLADDKRKIELTYYKNIYTGEDGHEVYMFKDADELQHHRSYNYPYLTLPRKYKPLAKKLREIHAKINFDEYKSRGEYNAKKAE